MAPTWLANLGFETGTKNDVYFLVYVHINRYLYPIYIHIEKRTPLMQESDMPAHNPLNSAQEQKHLATTTAGTPSSVM